MNLFEKGIEKGIVRFDEEHNFITYIHQNKKRNFNNPKDVGVPYIKVANVRKGNFDFSKIQYISFDSKLINKAIQLKKGNL